MTTGLALLALLALINALVWSALTLGGRSDDIAGEPRG